MAKLDGCLDGPAWNISSEVYLQNDCCTYSKGSRLAMISLAEAVSPDSDSQWNASSKRSDIFLRSVSLEYKMKFESASPSRMSRRR